MVGEIDAHGLRRDLIVADGLERAAVGRVDEQQDDADAPASKIGMTALRRKITLPEAFVMLKSENVG